MSAAEISYRAALSANPSNVKALDRLGRMYLRFRETIPAAAQCFFKMIEYGETMFGNGTRQTSSLLASVQPQAQLPHGTCWVDVMQQIRIIWMH